MSTLTTRESSVLTSIVEGGITVATLSLEEYRDEQAPLLGQELLRLVRLHDPISLVIDCSTVVFLSSLPLGQIINVGSVVLRQAHQKKMVLCCMNLHLQSVCDRLHLRKIMQFADTRDAAKNIFIDAHW